MSISQRLELRQSQQLVMTPQLQQAIKLLQMSNIELTAFVGDEITRNPLLEREAEETIAPPDQRAQADGVDHAIATADPAEVEAPFDTGQENLYEARAATPPPTMGDSQTALSRGGADGEAPNLEELLTPHTSLMDHVAAQLPHTAPDALSLATARVLAGDLDEAGYLSVDLSDLARRLDVTERTAEQALRAVQACDPAGVGARDLAECLALQLRERDRFDPAMEALVGALPLLARADFAALREICGVDEADLRDMIQEIRALNPRPGAAFASGPAVTAPPDVFVKPHPVVGWMVELNTETLPRVLVDNVYAAQVDTHGDEAAKVFISECRQNATWLQSALAQRARTILKVATEIVRQQDDFFTYGVRALKPMTLKTVAEAVGMHESTISRVTAGKYLATERGMFELKFFFSQSIARADGGEAVSAASVQHHIRTMIAEENPRKTLSDDKIVKMLRDLGVDIARRTVAKYREAMNIPSSVQRKRLKMQ